VPTSLDPKK